MLFASPYLPTLNGSDPTQPIRDGLISRVYGSAFPIRSDPIRSASEFNVPGIHSTTNKKKKKGNLLRLIDFKSQSIRFLSGSWAPPFSRSNLRCHAARFQLEPLPLPFFFFSFLFFFCSFEGQRARCGTSNSCY